MVEPHIIMKTGLGLYRRMLTRENFRFARQAGATHIVAHLTDYFNAADSLSTGSGGEGWGVTRNRGKYWSYEELRDLKAGMNAEGLELVALENFDPAFWYDILLDGPEKVAQIEGIKTIIRMGYNFSIAGVWGRTNEVYARGGAPSVGYVEQLAPEQTPIPNGAVWNMIYNPDAPGGTLAPITYEQMHQRRQEFLEAVLPVAEEAGVKLAAHPEDPPLPSMRGAARLITQPSHFIELMEAVPSPNNVLELCVGTMGEMQPDGLDLYDAIARFSREDRIGYVHLRNVVGKVPNYQEVFIDEGEVDMMRVLKIMHDNGYEGVIIPDHTPQMTCDAPWHAGMAYALGWINASIQAIRRGII